MKTCPYCDSQIPETETVCPQCRKEYWSPRLPEENTRGEKTEEEEQKPGCLQIFFLPLITAILSAMFLISTGIIANLFLNFESNQLKIAWLLASAGAGLAVYFFFSRQKRKRDKN